VYDALSDAEALDAFEIAYGSRVLPTYDFAKAEVIVSVGADFLGDWQGGGHSAGYAKGRIPTKHHGKASMSKHYQFESNMTLSGASADVRVPSTPATQKQVLAAIYGALVGKADTSALSNKVAAQVNTAIKQLKRAGKNAVVVTGLPSVNAQRIALAINELLNSRVIDTQHTTTIRQGNPSEVAQLVDDLNSGAVQGIITAGINPAYSLPNADSFAAAMSKAKFSLAFGMKNDETASLAQWVAATPHYLEAWGDVAFKSGHYGLTQPTIRPLFDTLQFQDVLLAWSGSETTYHDALQSHWKSNILNGASWSKAVHDGFFVCSHQLQIHTKTIPQMPTIHWPGRKTKVSVCCCILKLDWGMANRQTTHGCKNFLIPLAV
jgi:molybdopterin-containing oxidoreductase family iron-sulfur binding subunit